MTITTIVIPTYNDYKSLEVLIKWIEETPSQCLKFLIVDNGSSDSRVSQLLSSNGHNWEGVHSPMNLGFGGGILFGISQTESDYVGWMPGNLKIDPRDIPSFIDEITPSELQLIKASRISRSRAAHTKTTILGIAQSVLLRTLMFDAGGTPTICSKQFISSLPNPPKDYAFESYVLFKARRAKMKVIRPPIRYTARRFGTSHWQAGLASEIKLFFHIIESSKRWG